MEYTRKNNGVCSKSTQVKINDDGIIEDVAVIGGCDGNLKGIMALLKGMPAKDAANLLSGIKCNERPTSCPDQISLAIK